MMQDGPRGEAFGGMRHSELPLFQADELVQCKNCKRMLVLGSFQEHQVGPVPTSTRDPRAAHPTRARACPVLRRCVARCRCGSSWRPRRPA